MALLERRKAHEVQLFPSLRDSSFQVLRETNGRKRPLLRDTMSKPKARLAGGPHAPALYH